ncbi:DUF502 domain-containing protein [Pseudobdellovibrio sp. HCB154]|uniref:DUF502 domain-containing protein n=1 Tax=Pseudobdellovibrio sp. HCB154 TaxID=3386277 RepID=UPI0039172467
MSRLQKIFISGLVAFLPIALSIYVISAGIGIMENLFGNFLRQILPEGAYIPGFGFLATIALILFLGFLVDNFVTATFFRRVQEKLREVPLIKIVYSPLRDLMNLFAKGQEQQTMQKVVLVHFTKSHSVLGLVTRESFNDLELKMILPTDRIAVYIPMSYGLGGYTVLVNKSDVEAVDMPIEKAMSLALTGWIQTDTEPKK